MSEKNSRARTTRHSDVAAVIPAAGAGQRMGGATPKVLLALRGEPMLVHTVRAFQDSPAIRWVIVVVRQEDASAVRTLLKRVGITKALEPCLGGASRAESVAKGVAAVPPEAGWVLVHDAARPCVTLPLIEQAVQAARRDGAVACGLPAMLTVKAADERGGVRVTLDRDQLWFAQTPQVFRRDWFVEALARAAGRLESFPDDAAVVESAGCPVRMIPGDPLNIKVTTPEDLLLAEAILGARAPARPTSNENRPRLRLTSV